MDYKRYIVDLINVEGFNKEDLIKDIIPCKLVEHGDLSLPCFKFVKTMKKSPAIIAGEFAKSIQPDEYISRIIAVNGYLNFTINKTTLAKNVLEEINNAGTDYGKSDIGSGKTVCIDYSSVNIAKPFHMGHLSTTVIGGALYRMYKHLGYNPIGINHLGDFGTQFGKLITAYKKWGRKSDIEKGGVNALQKLYVKFNNEATFDESLNDEARKWFKRIEDKEQEALEIFEWFKEITLTEVKKIYDILDIHFDSYNGESFYNDKMQPILDELKTKKLLVDSEGAKVVELDKYDMPPCLLVKKDGATLYATRDIAAAFYRKKTYDFYKCLYVVAYQQNLHFQQVFKVIELMGYDWAKDLEHVAFGMVSINGEAMSTRQGKVVYLMDAIDKCVEKSKAIIKEKNPNLENLDDTAQKIGVGAVVFSALINNRIKDIDFNYEKVLTFDGETGPYVQYTYARCKSVLEKAEIDGEIDFSNITQIEGALISKLDSFKQVLIDCVNKNEPSMLTRLVVDIAKVFNKFYYDQRIINEDKKLQNFRLYLTKATSIVIKTGLKMLGISAPEKM